VRAAAKRCATLRDPGPQDGEGVLEKRCGDAGVGEAGRGALAPFHALAERLTPHCFDGGHQFTEDNLKMLAEDTPEGRERDRETVEAWYRAQGIDRAGEAVGARERLLARLGTRG
jgi:hypothetical protein